ncbi:MAG: SIMPL domain-containing protein [Ghiorsea sp.]
MKKLNLLAATVFLFSATPLWAEAEKGTIVSLTAEATIEVANDEVIISFRVEERGKKLDALRQRVNQMSASIEKSLAKEKGVRLKTSSRRVDPIWQKGSYQVKREGWLVVQSGSITSKNLEDVPRWLDIIEHVGAKLQGLSFRISDSVRRETQEDLRIQAIHQFQAKANTVVHELGATYFQILHLNTGSSTPSRPMYRSERTYMAKSMAVGDAAPALSSGESQISVSVSGDIEVEKKRFSVQ